MLQEFRVDNFKSLINVIFKPQAVNLLLGMNNSGKTNLCQALRFVAGSTALSLDRCSDLVCGRFGMTSFVLDKSAIDFYVRALVPYEDEELLFEYELTISPPKDSFGDASVRLERESLNVSGGGTGKAVLLENVAGRIRLLHEHDSAGGTLRYVETTAPTDATMLQRLYDTRASPRANWFKQYVSGWTYYDLSPTAMRGSTHKPRDFVVTSDGSNLASVLYSLKTGNEREYRKLLKVVQRMEPRLDLVNFYPGSENDVFMFFEDRDSHRWSSVNASNGTLRFLALAYILLTQPGSGLSPLCIIEEPENGIHVGFLKTLFEMVDHSEGRPQLIFTSHAPYFIDLFDEYLGGVFVLDRSKGHTSITQPDVDEVKARLEHYPLGEQHFREMLG
jgi:predicted ATPase